MKKLIIIAFGFISAISLGSCKGNYMCTCTYNGNVVYEGEGEGKKSDRETDCNLRKTSVLGQTWDCDLK
jgi:hypothetical protein